MSWPFFVLPFYLLRQLRHRHESAESNKVAATVGAGMQRGARVAITPGQSRLHSVMQYSHIWISVFDNARTKFMLTLPSTECGICCVAVAGSEVSSSS